MMKKVAIILCMLLVGAASAELLVHESFEAMDFGSRPVNNPAENYGIGIAAWWDNTAAYADITESVVFGSYPTGDQSVNYGQTTGTNRRVDFNKDASIVIGETLYFSFIFNGISLPDAPYNVGWSVETSGVLAATVITNGGGIGTSIDGTTVAEDNSNTLVGNGTFMIISKFDGIGTSSGSSKIWAVDPIAYGSIAGGGVTEAELDSVATLQAASSGVDATGVVWDGQDYRYVSPTPGAESIIDEVKMGTTLADVADNPNVSYAYAPSPVNNAVGVNLDVNLLWYNPIGYDASKFVINFQADEPNWIDTENTIVVTVEDLDLDGDPLTTEAAMPVELENLRTYYWRVISTDPAGPTDYVSSDWSFTTVTALAKIETQPVGQTVADGTNVQLNIGGVNITSYQWFKDGAALDVGHPDIAMYSGAQSGTLSFDVTFDTEGTYYCKVDNELLTPAISNTVNVMTERLVGWWKLDGDLTDSVADEVSGVPSHDGICVDPNYIVDGIDGGAIEFFGNVEGIVEIVDSGEYYNFYPQGYTVSAWVNMPGKGSWGGIVAKEGLDPSRGFLLQHDNTGDARHTLRQASENGGSDVDNNEWHMVTGTYDSETKECKLYVDGILEQTLTSSGTPDTSSASLVFGGEVVDASIAPYIGLLDDVRVYSYPLDVYQIAHLYTDFETGVEICVNRPSLDVSGPSGDPDCQVNLFDFTVLAGQWLNCDIVPDCK